MLISIIINILVTVVILSFDLFRQNFKQLKYSSILIAITVNGLINLFISGEYDFITFTFILSLIIWTLLQLYINNKVRVLFIEDQKFIAAVLTIILSTSTILAYDTSHDSYYMSVPYLAPTISLIGAILLFYSTFKPTEQAQLPFIKRVKNPILFGHILYIISFAVMMLLTPYWYAFILIYIIFILFILWQKIFKN
ncbi:hypothetical protein [Staphylococcus kloosii]|uniref:Uncharacterized protein n=1 Tax=Staphylococcus kloosii TaxID=29384 RepID=A0A151A6R9_9STAP|nr:hypothetical protein [Staphylococcus kloosii]KYH15134.1 hypothetical protein A0131_10185 [Staphylococcus kloosii]